MDNHIYVLSFTSGSETGLAIVTAATERNAINVLRNSGRYNGFPDAYKILESRNLGVTACIRTELIMESYVNAMLAFKALTTIAPVQGEKGGPGDKGDPGLSAYDIARLAGYTGSVEEWLESLHATVNKNNIQNALGYVPASESDLVWFRDGATGIRTANTSSPGGFTVAEGYNTLASTIFSHSEGWSDVSISSIQYTNGKYTVLNGFSYDGDSVPAHSVIFVNKLGPFYCTGTTSGSGSGGGSLSKGPLAPGLGGGGGESNGANKLSLVAFGSITFGDLFYLVSNIATLSTVPKTGTIYVYRTGAFGVASHLEGYDTITLNTGEHAGGQYNVSRKASSGFGNAGNTTFTHGIGTSSGRKNGLDLRENGDFYVYGIGSYNGVPGSGSTLQSVISGLYSKPIGGIPASDIASGVVPSDLSDLSDVSSTVPTDGQALIWDSTNSVWKPGAAGTPDAVKYVSQSLTSEQQAQARTNIGAGTYSKPSGGIPAADLASGVIPDVSGKEDSSNKVSTLTGNESDTTKYPNCKAVYDAIDALPEPMVFRGTIGTNGDTTTVPSSPVEGDTYKIISGGESLTFTGITDTIKVGDTVIYKNSTAGWSLIPSGDEPSGTVTAVTAGAGLNTTSNDTGTDGGTISSSGTIHLTKSGVTAGTYQGLTVDKYGRVTAASNQNYGTYSKPSGGIPASDLASGVIPTVPVQDVTVGGSSVLSGTTAVIPAIPDAVVANPTVPAGTTPTDLANLKVGNSYYAIPQGSQITVDSALSDSSENPVQNKVVKAAIDAANESLFVIPIDVQTSTVDSSITYQDIVDAYDAKKVFAISLGSIIGIIPATRVAAINGEYGILATLVDTTSGVIILDVSIDASSSSITVTVGTNSIDVPAISTDISADATSDTKTASPKAVKTYADTKYTKPSGGIPASDLAADVIPVIPVDTAIPSGGLDANVHYELGTLTGSVSITLDSTSAVSGQMNIYSLEFTAGSTAPTIAWPSSITNWAGNCLDQTTQAPVITAGNTYEVTIQGGLAVITEYLATS